jgi:hypothetical protein
MKSPNPESDKHIELSLDLELAESYMHGEAHLEGRDYPINIQGGESVLVLPEAIYNSLQSESAVVISNFRTESGGSFLVKLPLKIGKDMIEVYSDELLLETGWKGDMPAYVELSSLKAP